MITITTEKFLPYQQIPSINDPESEPDIVVYPDIFTGDISTKMFELLKTLPYQKTKYRLFGRIVESPRKMLWFADNLEWTYVFSKNHIDGLKPQPFPSFIDCIRVAVEKITQQKFNACLVNEYINGDDSISPHDDDDPWLGKDFIVPSVSFGEVRTFSIRKKGSKTASLEIPTLDGSLIIMRESVQKYWQHYINKEKDKGTRYNLTFRYIHPELVDTMPRPIILQKPFYNIFAKKLSGTTYTIRVEPDTTVLNIKEQLEDRGLEDALSYSLFFDGNKMNDDDKVIDYNIQENDTISLVIPVVLSREALIEMYKQYRFDYLRHIEGLRDNPPCDLEYEIPPDIITIVDGAIEKILTENPGVSITSIKLEQDIEFEIGMRIDRARQQKEQEERLEKEKEAERIRLEKEAEQKRLEEEAERVRLEREAEQKRLEQIDQTIDDLHEEIMKRNPRFTRRLPDGKLRRVPPQILISDMRRAGLTPVDSYLENLQLFYDHLNNI